MSAAWIDIIDVLCAAGRDGSVVLRPSQANRLDASGLIDRLISDFVLGTGRRSRHCRTNPQRRASPRKEVVVPHQSKSSLSTQFPFVAVIDDAFW